MDNTLRALRQVVSVSGWIAEFADDESANVHIDAVFRTGSFGESADAQVRFKLALKRAEIIVCIPNEEPIKIIKKSIRRIAPSNPGKRTIHRQSEVKLQADTRMGFAVETGLSVGGGLEAGTSLTQQTTDEVSFDLREYIEQHFYDESGRPAWEFSRRDKKQLSGAPLDATDEPVVSVRRSAARNADGGKPTIKIEIRCKREDLHIYDLEPKDPATQQFLQNKKNRDFNIAAAEQVIKSELAKAGFLEIADLSENQGQMLVADVIITEDD
jgi:hypothetical protein